MKKTKFLALSLVVAFAFTGTAFAYWGQDIVSNTTVNTGKLEVAVQNPEAYVYGGDNNGNEWDGWVIADRGTLDKAKKLNIKGITDVFAATSVKDNNVTASVANMYPGSKINIVYDVLNTGSIPVKISGLEVDGLSGSLAEHYNFEVQIVDRTIADKTKEIIWTTGNVDYAQLQNKLNDPGLKAINIDPTKKVTVSIFASFDRNVDDANLKEGMHEMEKFTFNAKTGFTQFNAK